MTKKLYSAERRMHQLNGSGELQSSGHDHTEILSALRLLREDVASLATAVHHAIPPVDEPDAPPPRQAASASGVVENYPAVHEAEVILLKTQLMGLARSITDTKKEIAALRPPSSDNDRLVVVSNELDAVVVATETATDTILDTAEQIDALASRLLSMGSDVHFHQIADEIKERVTNIFEACNFQDVTGQRITKVVNTLKYVEERIEAMIEIWGQESFRNLSAASHTPADDLDAKLLNGPQLQAASQDDIDALFG
ncbi:MAG: protein phosphatase CheZ [Alphaproteobacteria bacterium]|nr:protein phosphatase CheZ [Alphaproteobacteria bacterium]